MHYTFPQLKEFRNSNREQFDDFIKNCRRELLLWWHQTGIDLTRDDIFPKSKKEMINSLWENLRSESYLNFSLGMLYEIIDDYLAKQRLMSTPPEKWHELNLKDDEKLKLAFLEKTGYLGQHQKGLIWSGTLVEFMMRKDVGELINIRMNNIQVRCPDFRDIVEIKNKAYQMFIQIGEREALAFLQKQKIKKHIGLRLIEDFKKQYDNYRGFSKNYASSEFEVALVKWLISEGIFFKRHYPYRAIAPTKGRETMDLFFPQAKTVGEIADDDDPIIHNYRYWSTMRKKEGLARNEGYEFYIIKKKDDWKGTFSKLPRGEMPKEDYIIVKEREIQVSDNLEERVQILEDNRKIKLIPSKRRTHFWDKNEMKGMYYRKF